MKNISFNEFNNCFVIGGISVQLSPDSMSLLKLLFEADYQPLSFNSIKQAIWPDDIQPDYALTLLVRELDKALKTAGIDAFSVVKVEGIGYALKKKTTSRYFLIAAFALSALVITLFTQIISPLMRSTTMINNRIVFLPEQVSSVSGNELYDEAIFQMQRLLSESEIIFLIGHNNDYDVTRELMDKYQNIGLLIEWYGIKSNTISAVRMDIYEAETRNLIASKELDITDFSVLDTELTTQVSNIESLLTSELLPLTAEAINNPYDPVWEQIRLALAKTPEPTN